MRGRERSREGETRVTEREEEGIGGRWERNARRKKGERWEEVGEGRRRSYTEAHVRMMEEG